MIETCTVCHRNVLNHACFITCSNCVLKCHIQCLPNVSKQDTLFINRHESIWFCPECLGENLPFCNLTDDDDFLSALSEYSGTPLHTALNLDDLVFNPLDMNDDHMESLLADNDPDVNFFNDMRLTTLSCDYFMESTFNAKYSKLPITKNCFSIIHSNVRSVSKNLSDFENYLSNLNCRFSVIALSETWLNETNSSLYRIANYNVIKNSRKGKRVEE